jgi:hypothetical protein
MKYLRGRREAKEQSPWQSLYIWRAQETLAVVREDRNHWQKDGDALSFERDECLGRHIVVSSLILDHGDNNVIAQPGHGHFFN